MANRKKTVQRTKNNAGLIWIAVLLVFIGELFFYAWCRVQCVQTGYVIAQQTRKQQEFLTLRNSLNIELARLKAPEHISRIARQKLKLQMPDPQQIVMVP